MSKRRNTKTLRKQEYPDFERLDDGSDDSDLFDSSPVQSGRFQTAVPNLANTPKTEDDGTFKEGHVVTCPDTAKNKEGGNALTTGTIVQLLHGEASVLDGSGFIHRVSVKQMYIAQN